MPLLVVHPPQSALGFLRVLFPSWKREKSFLSLTSCLMEVDLLFHFCGTSMPHM